MVQSGTLGKGITGSEPFACITMPPGRVYCDGHPAQHDVREMPDPKDDPKSSEWRPYLFARDQWHCRICGDRFLYSETVRKHIVNNHNETMPPSMYEYFHGAVWQRKKFP